MNVLILGGNGYIGWPLAMRLSNEGHNVSILDDHSKLRLMRKVEKSLLKDPKDLGERSRIWRDVTEKEMYVYPSSNVKLAVQRDTDCIIHLAEQPSAPLSMLSTALGTYTITNNIGITTSLMFAVRDICPHAHIIKLGTMGEYGTPNIDIEEGWLDIEHKGRRDRFLFPRAAGSIYHTTKVMDTDLLWFGVRAYGLRVTDLMQGPVYGMHTAETYMDPQLYTDFAYDEIFGTVLNRFLYQAATGQPLTVYGSGEQTRGFLSLEDCLQCIQLCMENPPAAGEMRINNQFTETFSVLELAHRVRDAAKQLGDKVTIEHVQNERLEKENHYYNPACQNLLAYGLKPHYLTNGVLYTMLLAIKACYP